MMGIGGRISKSDCSDLGGCLGDDWGVRKLSQADSGSSFVFIDLMIGFL